MSTSPAPSHSSVASYDDTPTDARMPSVFAPAPSLHRAQSSSNAPGEPQRAGPPPPTRPYSDYRSDTASIHSVASTHSVPARFSRPLSGSSAASVYGHRVLPLPQSTSSTTTPVLEHRRPPSFLDNLPASSARFSTVSDPDQFRLRVNVNEASPRSSVQERTSVHEEPPIHLPPILSPGLSRKRSNASMTSAFSQYQEPQKARSIRSFQSSFDDRSSITSSFDNRSEADPLDYSLPQGWTGPAAPRKVGRSSAAAARIMQRRMKKNQMDSAAMGIEDELAKTDIEEGTLRYVFVVVQQPVRARACGFGDKVRQALEGDSLPSVTDASYCPLLSLAQDRRPLSPTPIIKCIVYDRQGNVVDPMYVSHALLRARAALR